MRRHCAATFPTASPRVGPREFPGMTSTLSLFGSMAAAWILSAAAAAAAPSQGGAQNTESQTSVNGLGISIGRDAHGVPHVFANTDAGALYGAGYAAAEDRLFQMFWMRLVHQGRAAQYFGPGNSVHPTTGVITKTHVQSDVRARAFGWSKHADRVVAAMDSPTLKLLQVYSNGVNARMSDPGALLDPLFTRYSVPLEPWTPADCVGAWLRFGEFFGSNGLEEARLMHEWQVLLNDPTLSHQERLSKLMGPLVCDDSAAVIQQEDVANDLQDLLRTYARAHGLNQAESCVPYSASPHFSQAWAVAGRRTTTGRSVLVGDPRIGVTLPSQLYEWSMHGATIAVRGIGVPGCPNILAGSTNSMAWSPTAIGLDQSDLVLLKVDPQQHPGQYQLDGQWIPFTNTNLEVIQVKGESSVSVLYSESYWGPVVTAVVNDAQPGEMYASRRAPLLDPTRDSTAGFLRMYAADSIDTFYESLEDWVWPSVNLVFSDLGGRIGYAVTGAVPVRNPKLVLAGVIAQDGSTTGSDWLDLLPHALKPHVLDPKAGYVFSANHRPVGTWYPIPIRYGTGGSGDTFRSRRVRELLSSNPPKMTPQEIYDIHHDVVSVGGRDLSEIGLWLKNQSSVTLSLNARRALQELGPWYQAGARADNSVRGTLVVWFMNFGFRLQDAGPELLSRYGGGETGLNLFLKQVRAKIRHSPPIMPTAAEIAYIDRILGDAVVKAQLVGPTTQWQSWYQQNVLTIELPKWTSLEGFPSLAPGQTVTMGPFRSVDAHTLLSPLRQIYTQFVELGSNAAPRSVAPPGTAEPVSTHDRDQVNLWQDEGLKLSPRTVSEMTQLGWAVWKYL